MSEETGNGVSVMAAQKIWVIGWDFGTEGKSEPEMAFWTKGEAERAVALISKNPGAIGVYLSQVPIWGGGS